MLSPRVVLLCFVCFVCPAERAATPNRHMLGIRLRSLMLACIVAVFPRGRVHSGPSKGQHMSFATEETSTPRALRQISPGKPVKIPHLSDSVGALTKHGTDKLWNAKGSMGLETVSYCLQQVLSPNGNLQMDGFDLVPTNLRPVDLNGPLGFVPLQTFHAQSVFVCLFVCLEGQLPWGSRPIFTVIRSGPRGANPLRQ